MLGREENRNKHSSNSQEFRVCQWIYFNINDTLRARIRIFSRVQKFIVQRALKKNERARGCLLWCNDGKCNGKKKRRPHTIITSPEELRERKEKLGKNIFFFEGSKALQPSTWIFSFNIFGCVSCALRTRLMGLMNATLLTKPTPSTKPERIFRFIQGKFCVLNILSATSKRTKEKERERTRTYSWMTWQSTFSLLQLFIALPRIDFWPSLRHRSVFTASTERWPT